MVTLLSLKSKSTEWINILLLGTKKTCCFSFSFTWKNIDTILSEESLKWCKCAEDQAFQLDIDVSVNCEGPTCLPPSPSITFSKNAPTPTSSIDHGSNYTTTVDIL
jgi:hypothetical protein